MKINLILAGCLVLGIGTLNAARILFVRNNTEGSVVITGNGGPHEPVVVPPGVTIHDIYVPGEAFIEYGKPNAFGKPRSKTYLENKSHLGIKVDNLGTHEGQV